MLADDALLVQFHAAIELWQQQWTSQSPRPILKVLDTGAKEVVIADTRRIARNNMVAITREQDATLKYFEQPRLGSGLPAAVLEEADKLLRMNFVVEHEGHLLSVVTRPRGALFTAERTKPRQMGGLVPAAAMARARPKPRMIQEMSIRDVRQSD